jgi:hypothetical protein
MGQVIPRQHPAVVLRSQYKAILAMLCVSLVAIVALATALVIVANDDNETVISAQPSAQQQTLPPGTRFDGGPDEGTRGIQSVQPQTLPPGTRFDGGPDEGTRGIQSVRPQALPPGTRFDGGPDEGTRGIQSSQPSGAQPQTMGARP